MKQLLLINKLAKKVIFIIIFLLSCACQIYGEEMGKEDEYFAEIYEQLAQEMGPRYGVILQGHGGGGYHGIHVLTVSFAIRKKININEAREIFININERFLYLINQHKNMKPLLKKYPFTIADAHASLTVNTKTGWPLDGSVALVCYGRGRVCYDKAAIVKRKNEPLRRWDGSYFDGEGEIEEERLIDLAKEPYEEAKAIVIASGKLLTLTEPNWK